MRNPELFLVLFPVVYLNTILILEANNSLNDPLDLGDFIRWVGCGFYMDCWVRILERNDWCSVTLPVIHRGYPFCLNIYMSRH